MAKSSPIGRISYRTRPGALSHPVKTAWKRLKAWSVANLPQFDGEDSPPATPEEFHKFEAAIGVTLPKDVRDSYRVYDGQCAGSGIIYGLAVVPLRESLNHWKHWVEGYGQCLKDGSASGLVLRHSCFVGSERRP